MRNSHQAPADPAGANPTPPWLAVPVDLDAITPGRSRLIVCSLAPGSAARQARALVRGALAAAGATAAQADDAELVVAELAANAERHARPPYELRLIQLAPTRVWYEVADADPRVETVQAVLDHLRTTPGLDLTDGETGRGLPLAHLLSGGECRVCPTTLLTTGTAGKAVSFPLPGVDLIPSAPSP